jgi:hypothetical protein
MRDSNPRDETSSDLETDALDHSANLAKVKEFGYSLKLQWASVVPRGGASLLNKKRF